MPTPVLVTIVILGETLGTYFLLVQKKKIPFQCELNQESSAWQASVLTPVPPQYQNYNNGTYERNYIIYYNNVLTKKKL